MLSQEQWHATIFPSIASLNGRWLVTDGCFTSCKMFQPFYEETKKPTKSKKKVFVKSFNCQIPFISYTRTHVLMARSCLFFSPVDLLVVQQLTMAMPWNFCSVASGGCSVMMTLTTLILVMPLGILGVLPASFIHFKMVTLVDHFLFAIRTLQNGYQAFNMFSGGN